MRDKTSIDATQLLVIKRAGHGQAKYNRNPHLEAALGTRIRAARVEAGMSLTALGEAIGMTHQQLRKYETGTDRVAASTLIVIAIALGVHPGSFFEDAFAPPRDDTVKLNGMMRASTAIQQVKDPATLQRIVALIEAIAEAEGGKSNTDGGSAET